MYTNKETLKQKMIYAKKLNTRFLELNTKREQLIVGDIRRMELLDRMKMINQKIIANSTAIAGLLSEWDY